MKLLLAKTISVILNPFFVALAGLYALVYRTNNFDINNAFKWMIFSSLFVGLSAGFIFFGRYKGFFSDVDMSNPKERRIFFPFIITLAIIFLLMLRFLNGPWILYYAISGAIVGFVVSGVINPYVKASAHVGIITAFALPFVLRYGGWFYFTFFLIAIVAWSRVYLKKHTLFEVIAGMILAGSLTIIVYYIVQYRV